MATTTLQGTVQEAESREDHNLEERIMSRSERDSASQKPLCSLKIVKLGKN